MFKGMNPFPLKIKMKLGFSVSVVGILQLATNMVPEAFSPLCSSHFSLLSATSAPPLLPHGHAPSSIASFTQKAGKLLSPVIFPMQNETSYCGHKETESSWLR